MGCLTGQIALVTGSSRGIGLEIAKLFAREGASVAVHGRDEAALSTARLEVSQAGGRVIAVRADLTRFAEIEQARMTIERELGPVDVLVANAGGNQARPGPLEETREEDWRAVVDGNLTATFLTLKGFLPGMKSRKKGNIITMSSAAARRPHPNSPIPYSAAKAGIHLLTQHVAAQVGPSNIRVNCLAPETILTDRNQKQIPVPLQDQMAKEHPLRRLGKPEDVAQAALFLASDASAWITGLILDVSGGAVMSH
jgi:3-oxoacyl-[acyl-carrier protein] reductase